jgi:hypothetical protein
LIMECSVMLLVLVSTLLRSVPVKSVPCAVDTESCDRTLDRTSSPVVSQGGGSRARGVCEVSGGRENEWGALVGAGAPRSDPVLDAGPSWSIEGWWWTDEGWMDEAKVLEDLEDDVERPRVLDQGLGAELRLLFW